MPLPVPPVDEIAADGRLRYYTPTEYQQIDLRRRGVSGEGDHAVEDFSPTGSGVVRKFNCRYEERYAAIVTLVGCAVSYTEAPFARTRISRLLPDVYRVAGNQKWVCTRAKITPFRFLGTISPIAQGISAPDFDRAEIECVYEEFGGAELREDSNTPYNEEWKRTLTQPGFPQADISGDVNRITLPQGTLKFATADGGAPAGIAVQHGWHFNEYSSIRPFVWRRVPKELWGEGTILFRRVFGEPGVLPFVGSVNSRTFFGYQPGSMLLLSVEEKVIPDPLFGYAVDLTYKFQHVTKPGGHLNFYLHSVDAAHAPGYYQVLRASRWRNTAIPVTVFPDHFGPFHVRDHHLLFNPNPSGIGGHV